MNSVPSVTSSNGPRKDRSSVALSLFMFGLRNSFVEQIQPQRNQRRRPVAQHAPDLQDVQVVQQKQDAEGNQQHRSRGKSGLPWAHASASQARKFVHRLSIPPLLGRVISLKRHVENKSGNHEPEQRLKTPRGATRQDTDDRAEDHHVHQALGILPVVNRSYAWDEAQNEGQRR